MPPSPLTPRQAARRRGPVDRALDPDLFRALGEPTRARLLTCLVRCGRPCSVRELATCCDVDYSVVARHLAHLERAGVLEVERRGKHAYYDARPADLATRLRGLADALEAEGCTPDGGCCP